MIGLTVLFVSTGLGCSLEHLATPDRKAKGLVLILPGIEGRSAWNHELARGLEEGGVRCAIELYDWGTEIPGGMFINLADFARNQRVAVQLKDHILAYRREYPRRPVHLVGHSGGGGLAVLAVEQLPVDEPVSSLVLLAPAISPNYDLTKALGRSQFGIFNYHSELDAVLLRAGTMVAGTIDRQHAQAAGAVGFSPPKNLDAADRRLYDRKLHQIKWEPEMRWYSHFGGHMDWTHRPFVRRYLAVLLESINTWRYDDEIASQTPIRAAAAEISREE